MALGIGYGLPFAATKSGGGQYKSLWNTARTGAKASGATVEDESADSSSCLVTRGADVYNDVLPTTPSLLIVPQFYKSANLYQDIPAYSDDSTTMRFTVTRATTATRVNSSGLIESVASGVPRIDWLGQSCPALLVEASGQNLVPNGVGFNTQTGVQTSGVTDSPAISISGTLCTKNEASGNTRYVSQVFSNSALASGTTYSVSRFFKYNGDGFNTSLEANQTTQWGGTAWKQVVVLSAASGVTLGTSTACTGSVENFGNGWYRVNVRVTTGATIGGTATVNVLSELPSALSTGQGFLAACPQLEASSIATTYIPTTTGSATRNADAITASGALVSGLIGQTEGTIYAEVDVRAFSSSLARRIVNLRVDGNNLFSLEMTTAGTQFDFAATSGGVSVVLSASGITTGIYKIAIGYNSTASGTALYVNGTLRDTKTIAIPNLSAAVFGLGVRGDGSAGSQLNDRIRAVALYTTRLTDSQLEQLTK